MVTGEKKILRKSMKATLSNLSEEEISRQSQLAQDLIINLPQYKNATRISVFLSMPKAEAQTDLIVQDALKLGKETFVPYIHRPPKSEDGERKKRSVIEMLRLASVEEYEGLERDSWGIPRLPTQGLDMRENARGSRGIESAETDDEGGLVLVVVPGVAFDAGLNRLGHGAGFYDEFLTRFCAGGKRQRPFLGKCS